MRGMRDEVFIFIHISLGTYFPVLRATDWATRKNKAFIEDKAVLAFIYIFGIVFILLSFIRYIPSFL